MSILEGDLAEQIADALNAVTLPQAAVVTVQETSGPEWEPIVVDVPYGCSGWIDEYAATDRANSDIQLNDRKIFIVASTLSVTPAPGHLVQIAGGAMFRAISVAIDPAGACWTLQGRV